MSPPSTCCTRLWQSPLGPLATAPFPYSRPSLDRSALRLPSSTSLSASSIRPASTARRTTKLLRPRPAASAAAASKYRQPARDTIVFNPPPSAPSPHHTPPLFLPPDDPRRRLLARSYGHANPYAMPAASSGAASTEMKPPEALSPGTPVTSASIPSAASLPPPLEKPRQKTYHLTAADIAEIRRLRAEDPFKYTRKMLAEKFKCTEFFVGMCAPANEERMEWAKANLEVAKGRWGPKRTRAREERTMRRELWNRDA